MVVAETEDRMQHVAHEKPDTLSQNVEMDESQLSMTSEEIFECNQCTDSFENRETLFKHVKVAHQQHVHCRRKFRCDQCQRTFKSMSGLRNHARTHSVYFGDNTDVPHFLSSGLPVHPVSREASGIHSTDGDASCTVDSTFTVEKECDSNISVYNDAMPGRVTESRNKCDSVRTKTRRRSSIPVPVRRSLLTYESIAPQQRLDDDINIRHSEASEQANTPAEKEAKSRNSTPTTHKVTRESRRLTRVINTGQILEAKQNVQRASLFKSRTPHSKTRTPVKKSKECTGTKLRLKSPFGTKYSTQVDSPGTPRNPSRSKSRTRQNGIRTPKSGKCTPQKGKHTPRKPGSSNHTPTRKGYNCKKCGKSFVDKSKLDVHFAVHARETPEKCGIPKHALKKTPSIQKDSPLVTEPVDTNNAGFSCTQCGRTYEKKKYLDAHMKTHDVITPFCCSNCDKKFRFLSSLKAHSFVHQGESRDPNTTLIMEHRMASKGKLEFRNNEMNNSLKFNIFSVLPPVDNTQNDSLMNDDIPFTCKMCDYKTRAPAELLTHLRTHSKSGLYTCKHCSKSYKLQANLRVHEKVHTIHRLKQLLIENTINKTANQSTVHTS